MPAHALKVNSTVTGSCGNRYGVCNGNDGSEDIWVCGRYIKMSVE